MREISASEFKAKCLAILDKDIQTRQAIIITKHGKPVAQLVRPVPRQDGYPQDALFGTVKIHGDIVEPVLEADIWEANVRLSR